MGGSYPLAALAIRPPAPAPDLMEQYARAVNLKNLVQLQPLQMQAMQSEVQQRQLQTQALQRQYDDANIYMQALKGSNGDMSAALKDASTKGMSGQGYLDYGNMITQHQTALAKLSETQLANEKQINDQLAGHIDAFNGLTPEDKTLPNWLTIRQQAVNARPDLDAILPKDTVPTADQVKAYDAMLQGGKWAVQNELDQRKATATEQEAQARAATAKTGEARLQAELPGGALYAPTIAGQSEAQRLAAEGTPQALQVVGKRAAAEEVARYGPAPTQAKLAQQQVLAGGANAAVASVAPHLVPTAIADATKAGQQYASAQQAADDMKTFIDSARAGNKVAYAYSPVEGVLTLNTGRGVKRVNMSEISAYGGAGSAFDRVSAFLGKQTSGASLPADILNDMAGLHQGVTDNARNAYSNNLKVINQNYGSNFQPVDLGRGGARTAGPPAGAVGKAPGSDGKMHYHDQRGNDLGVVGGQ